MVGSVKAVLRRLALWVLESTITECQPTGSLPRCGFVSSHCRWRYLDRTQAIRKTTAPRGLIPFTVRACSPCGGAIWYPREWRFRKPSDLRPAVPELTIRWGGGCLRKDSSNPPSL